VGLAGCGEEPAPPGGPQLSYGLIKSKVVKGATTQAEIIDMFGSPTNSTVNSSGEEVWVYDRISSSSRGKSASIWFLLGGSSGYETQTSMKTLTFIVTFDQNKIVKEYAARQSQF